MDDIDKLLQDSIDMHIHPQPENAAEVARQAQQMGMKAIVFKSHHYPTAALSITTNQLVPEIQILGSLCLNHEIGGFNSHALESSAKLGAKVVWMPTFSSANSKVGRSSASGVPLDEEGLPLLNSNGELVPEVEKILSLVKDYDMVLASGHISPRETFALVKKARQVGISKIIITHPLAPWILEDAFTLDDLQQLIQQGAYIEHCLWALMPTGRSHDPAEMVEGIKTLGAEHCVMTTDFGQVYNPSPAEGMRIFIATMLKHGLSPEEIEFMVNTNPARLLRIG